MARTGPHSIQCTCGAFAGTLAAPPWVNRVICYCDDCQAFAEYLGRAEEILDGQGGSDIVQTAPRQLTFSRGREHLACVRLTPSGVLRWYASCCNTPIGNTPANPKFAFVGLLHNALDAGAGGDLDQAFGPARMQVFTQFAKGEPKPESRISRAAIIPIVWRVAWTRLSGAYRINPFFDAESGEPVVTPAVPSPAADNGDAPRR